MMGLRDKISDKVRQLDKKIAESGRLPYDEKCEHCTSAPDSKKAGK